MLASLQWAELTQVDVDVLGQTFSAAKLQLNQPKARAERDAENNWMHARGLVTRDQTAPDPSSQVVPAWKIAINDVLLSGGAMPFSDKAGVRPVAFEVTALNARSGRLVLDDSASGFGGKVEGATARLPVKLAVALLADRNGEIDLDLPISGSLNDPQFSPGPVIIKVILNMIVKAITAPFSLRSHALGGSGDAVGRVGFAPGST